MAYNPALYAPYGHSQPVWGQVSQGTGVQPVNGLVSVTGAEAARAYPLPPNSSMPLFDANDDVMYVKTTDGAGFPTVKAYRFEQVDASEESGPDYVRREEFEQLSEKLDKVLSALRRKEGGHAKQPVPEDAE